MKFKNFYWNVLLLDKIKNQVENGMLKNKTNLEVWSFDFYQIILELNMSKQKYNVR